MMRETLRFLTAPVRGLHSAVYILAAFAVLSSLLALLRDRLCAHFFGAGTELDIYYAAFRIPDLLFVAIGSLVSVYILIPELSKRSLLERRTYIDTVVVGFSILAVLSAVVAAIFAPKLLALLFPQFAGSGSLSTVVLLTRIMLLQPILLGLSNILAALTQTAHRYVLYSLSPFLYNLGIILGLVVLYPQMGLAGLAWGVVLGAALHLGIQVPSAVGDGYFHALPLLREKKALMRTALISIPRALTLSMNQLAFLALLVLAGMLSSGSIAVFVFGYNLMSVPLSIIGASYSVAAFPTLASALSRGSKDDFIQYVGIAARYILFWSLPATALAIVLRAHLVRVVLGSGAFDWTDTRLTAAVFAILSLTLAAQGLMLLLARAYYAAGRTFVPFIVATFSAVGTLALGVGLLRAFEYPHVVHFADRLMRLESVPGTSIIALAVAFALTSIVATLTLALLFERRFGGFFGHIARTMWQAGAASLGAGMAAYLVLAALGPLTLFSTVLSVFSKGFAAGLAGIATAAFVYALTRNREYRETITAIRARLWKEEYPASPPLASAEEISSSSP